MKTCCTETNMLSIVENSHLLTTTGVQLGYKVINEE